VHRRRLYLAETGDDLRGEDIVEMQEQGAKPPGFVLRFHLHPGVTASLQEDDQAVLLRLPSGQGWRMRANGARASLEESLYLGGEQRRNRQIVLTAEAGQDTVQWALGRVTATGPGEAAEA
jgi:uncharacterized heparinase superfamily protein